MTYSYRTISEVEESPHERALANLGIQWISRKLDIPDDVPVRFITPASNGEFRVENPVVGLGLGSREIYLLKGLAYHSLIDTLCHETRHIFQVINRKHCLDSETRERDAWLFVRETNVPRMEGRELRLWLLRQQMFEKEPGSRAAYARVGRLMQERAANPG